MNFSKVWLKEIRVMEKVIKRIKKLSDSVFLLVRKCYDWVLSWAESEYSKWALFIFAFLESSIFPVPPDVLLIALCIGKPSLSYVFALIASIGSVLGGIGGYLIGMFFWDSFAHHFFEVFGYMKYYFKVKALYDEYNFWIVFAAGFTPIPYKVFTILGGLFKINFPVFVFASALSRSSRFFLTAFLLKVFGPSIKEFIDKYFNLLSILFVALLIAGFFALKYLF